MSATISTGVIEPGVIYTKSEALRRLGWREASYRSARRQGLKRIRSGRNTYISGSELIRYLQSLQDASKN